MIFDVSFGSKLYHIFFKPSRPYLNRLNFLPDCPELDQINAVVREESNLTVNTEFQNTLRHYTMSMADSENREVKSQTLSRLFQVNIFPL